MRLVQHGGLDGDSQDEQRQRADRQVQRQVDVVGDREQFREPHPRVQQHGQQDRRPGDTGGRSAVGATGSAVEPQRDPHETAGGGRGERHRQPPDAGLDERRAERLAVGQWAGRQLRRQPGHGGRGGEGGGAEQPDAEPVQRLAVPRAGSPGEQGGNQHQQRAGDRDRQAPHQDTARGEAGVQPDVGPVGDDAPADQTPGHTQCDSGTGGHQQPPGGQIAPGVDVMQIGQHHRRETEHTGRDQRRLPAGQRERGEDRDEHEHAEPERPARPGGKLREQGAGRRDSQQALAGFRDVVPHPQPAAPVTGLGGEVGPAIPAVGADRDIAGAGRAPHRPVAAHESPPVADKMVPQVHAARPRP